MTFDDVGKTYSRAPDMTKTNQEVLPLRASQNLPLLQDTSYKTLETRTLELLFQLQLVEQRVGVIGRVPVTLARHN